MYTDHQPYVKRFQKGTKDLHMGENADLWYDVAEIIHDNQIILVT